MFHPPLSYNPRYLNKVNILHIEPCVSEEKRRKIPTQCEAFIKGMMIMHRAISPFPSFTLCLFSSFSCLHFSPSLMPLEAMLEALPPCCKSFIISSETFRSHIYVYVRIKKHKFNALWKSRRVNLSVFPWNFPRKQNTIE